LRKHPIVFGFLVTSAVLICFAGMFVLSLWMLHGIDTDGSFFSLRDSVAVVEVRGAIWESRNIIEQLQHYADDGNVKAIVLRVDSPGGAVGPSQEIYDEVKRINDFENPDRKPIVVSMGSVAASGGYYISACADQIVANPGTITGSIGVIMEFIDYQGVYEWVGLKSNVIKTGEFKDIGSGTRDMTAADQELLQGVADNVLDQFVQAIVEGRNMAPELVKANADGRIFSGQQALELGFVDKLGNLKVAIDEAAMLGGIDGEPNVIYPPRRQPRGLFSLMFRGVAEAMLDMMAEQDRGDIRFSFRH